MERPAKCHVCGKGAHFDQDSGVRVLDPDNWIVLADLSDAEFSEIAATHLFDPKLHKIVAHTPDAPADPDREPVSISVEAGDAVASEDVQE